MTGNELLAICRDAVAKEYGVREGVIQRSFSEPLSQAELDRIQTDINEAFAQEWETAEPAALPQADGADR